MLFIYLTIHKNDLPLTVNSAAVTHLIQKELLTEIHFSSGMMVEVKETMESILKQIPLPTYQYSADAGDLR